MNSRVLLISENYFKDRVFVSDSIGSKLVITSIEEVQNFYISSVIGDLLLDEILNQVETQTLTELNRTLVDNYLQPLILFKSAIAVITKCNIHVGNQGLNKSTETVDSKSLIDYYENQASIALTRLTDYIGRKFSSYPLLGGTMEGKIHSHIDAKVDTGLWLGSEVKVHEENVDIGWRR